MKTNCLLMILLVLAGPVQALTRYPSRDVAVEIVADDGRVYPVHGLQQTDGKNTWRAWLEAAQGGNYGIRIRNLTGTRIGLVIAVDGRNIISGEKSWLRPDERMYILGPWQQATYEGWRTSDRLVNRFFFTDAGDSYAGAWDDYSAMGVIALAVYPERRQVRPQPHESRRQDRYRDRSGARAEAPAAAGKMEGEASADSAASLPGTGFGDEQYSYARSVQFDPARVASSRHYFKYEWRETLCDKGIISCARRPDNRFWPDSGDNHGFAPYPPGR